jgi:hypothetical protein
MTGSSEDELPDASPDIDIPTPLSFKVMVVLAGIYLLYRLGQGVVWLIQALSG